MKMYNNIFFKNKVNGNREIVYFFLMFIVLLCLYICINLYYLVVDLGKVFFILFNFLVIVYVFSLNLNFLIKFNIV